MPHWPLGRSAGTGNTSYLLNRYSKHPDVAWTLMKWLTGAEGNLDWSKFQIQVSLVTPGLIGLWEYWETAVVSVAPVLQGKQLQWFADPERHNYEHAEVFLRQQPVQADTLVQSWLTRIIGRQVGVQEGLRQMQDQVNALQQAAANLEPAQQQAATRFPTQGPAMAVVQSGV